MRSKAGVLLFAAMVCGLIIGLATMGIAQEESLLRINFHWPSRLDPAVGLEFNASSAYVNLYDALVYPVPDGVILHAAESYEVSKDNLTYIFKLHKGIKFHSGNEMTAEDVKFSMDRLLEIGEGFSYLYLGKVDHTEVIDKYTVSFTLNVSFGPFLSSLIRLYILEKASVMANLKDGPYGSFGDYGKEFLLTHDAGSGAYMLKEMGPGEYVLMEKFAGYWGEILPNAPDLVKFVREPSAVTVKTMMARRELEITTPWLAKETYQDMAKIPGVEVVSWSNGFTEYEMWNTKKPPTDDIHFRKALNWMLDWEQVLTGIYPGWTQAAGPIAHNLPGFKEGLFQYYQDMDKAREELQKSKYADQLEGLKVTLGANSLVPRMEQFALMLQANAAEFGIDVEIIKMPWGKMVEVVGSIETNPNGMHINVAPHYPEAGSMLAAKYHSNSAGTWEQSEYLLSDEIDALIDDALATIDQDERFRKYGLLQEVLVELAPSMFIVELLEEHAYQAAYVDWSALLDNPSTIMGYNYDCRYIEVYPDRIP